MFKVMKEENGAMVVLQKDGKDLVFGGKDMVFETGEEAKTAVQKLLKDYAYEHALPMMLRNDTTQEEGWVLKAETDGYEGTFRIYDTEKEKYYADPIGYKVKITNEYGSHIDAINEPEYSEDSVWGTKEEAEKYIWFRIESRIKDYTRETIDISLYPNCLDPDFQWDAVPHVKPKFESRIFRDGDKFKLWRKEIYPNPKEETDEYEIIQGYPRGIEWFNTSC